MAALERVSTEKQPQCLSRALPSQKAQPDGAERHF
eukprot:COSAG04_NODE_19781_length_408_cov_0.841424_1_plen_34_part_10